MTNYSSLCLLFFNKCLFFTKWKLFKNYKRCFFISSKKLFFFSRYSKFCISIFPSFSPCQRIRACFRAWSKINLKVYDIIKCLNKNLITHLVWHFEKEERYGIETLSIDRVLNKEHFYGKIMQKMCTKS